MTTDNLKLDYFASDKDVLGTLVDVCYWEEIGVDGPPKNATLQTLNLNF